MIQRCTRHFEVYNIIILYTRLLQLKMKTSFYAIFIPQNVRKENNKHVVQKLINENKSILFRKNETLLFE